MTAAAAPAALQPPAQAPTLDPVEVFKPGRHQPTQGEPEAFSEADLVRAAQVYDPALHRAPLVVGHPKTDDPAYGHVGRLAYASASRRLMAHPAEVEPAFCELVASGRLLAVSASWYRPDSPLNPVPGAWYLRHVGFLGAQPPAVKGLKRPTVSFGEAEEGVVEFGDWTDETQAGLWRRMREWLISKFGLEEADQAVPGWSVDSLQREAAQPPAPAPAESRLPSFTEPGAPHTVSTTPATPAAGADPGLEARRAELDRREADIQRREQLQAHGARLSEFGEFADGLVKAGQLLPRDKAAIVAVLAGLPAAQVVEFADGDKTINRPAVEVLRDFLKTLPKQVEFQERAGLPRQGGATTGGVDLSDGAAIAQAATEFMEAEAKAGRQVPLDQAVQHVIDTHREPA